MTSSSITSQSSSPPPTATTASFSFMSSSQTSAEIPPIATQTTSSGVPKFKSTPPASLPISPSPYFSIPGGLSPADLLDSPVLLSSSNNFPSPTTGSFPLHAFNWKSNFSGIQEQDISKERYNFSDFSFQSQSNPPSDNHQQFKDTDDKDLIKSEYQPQMQSFSPEISAIQTHSNSNSNSNSTYAGGNNSYNHQSSQNKSNDGYNWRKYGQKQVKGSENPRSYYKCTHPNCSMRKKVEMGLNGQITEIVYRGSHNHDKPQSTRRSSASNNSQVAKQDSSNHQFNDYPDQSYGSNGSGQQDYVGTPENSSISIGDDEFDRGRSAGDEVDEDEPKTKIQRIEGENEGISTAGSRTVREPRVVVQTISDIDILDDGFRWRKYGQKVVKGNPNPRSYYKCTTVGCSVRKLVERASHDLRAVITTYEGRHNHDVPLARGAGQRPPSANLNNVTVRPVAMSHYHPNPIRGSGLPPSPFTLHMLQSSQTLGPSEFEINQQQNSKSLFSKTKEEPKDDMFFESLLF